MDKFIVAPPDGSTNNGIGAEDRKWKEGHFEKLPGINEYIAESTGYGIVSGCEPSISGLTVTVGAGIIHLADGTRKELSATNITLDSADLLNPRIDLVYIDSASEVAKITGTASASPSAPTLPTNGISVCNVTLAAGTSTGTLTDMRGIIGRYQNVGIFNVKDFGANGDGVTDDSIAFQNASRYADILIIPDGTYIVKDCVIEHDVTILGYNATLLPVYENDNAQNIITIRNTDKCEISGIRFYGTNEQSTHYELMRQSALECVNVSYVNVSNCIWETISNTVTSIEEQITDRKGTFATFHDVDYLKISGCQLVALGADEGIWVAPKTKAKTNTVIIQDCITKNNEHLSQFNIIAKDLFMYRVVSGETDNSPNISWANLFCENITVKDCKFRGTWDNYIDTHEASLNFVETLYIIDNEFSGAVTQSIYSMVKTAVISGNNISTTDSSKTVTQFINLLNNLPSSEMASKYKFAYNAIEDAESVTFINNHIIYNGSNSNTQYNVLSSSSSNTHKNYYVKDNYVDCKNKKGAVLQVANTSVIMTGNLLKNIGIVSGTSGVKGVISATSLTNFILSDNVFDASAGLLFGKSGDVCIDGNIFDSENLTSSFTSEKSFVGINSCQSLKSDTLKIDCVPAVFEGQKNMQTTNSLVSNIDIGDIISVSNGVLWVATSNGAFANVKVSEMPTSQALERGTKVQLTDGTIIKIITYATYAKANAPDGTSASVGDYLLWDGQDVIVIAKNASTFKTITVS